MAVTINAPFLSVGSAAPILAWKGFEVRRIAPPFRIPDCILEPLQGIAGGPTANWKTFDLPADALGEWPTLALVSTVRCPTHMHTTKLFIVACPFLASCYGGGPRTNTEAGRAKPTATSFPVVSAIERLALRRVHFYEHLVIDSAALVSAARMTAAEIAELSERLRDKVSVGEATVGGACQRRLDALCWSMRVSSFGLAGDSARIRVEWIPVAGCGDSLVTFVLNRQAFVVSEYDQVTGDC